MKSTSNSQDFFFLPPVVLVLCFQGSWVALVLRKDLHLSDEYLVMYLVIKSVKTQQVHGILPGLRSQACSQRLAEHVTVRAPGRSLCVQK